MMWSTQQEDGRQKSVATRNFHPEVESGHVQQAIDSSPFLHPSHQTPMAMDVTKPGNALLLSSTIRPLLVTADDTEPNNYYIPDRWSSSSASSDHLLSNKQQTAGTSSQSSFFLVDEIATMKQGMNIGVGVSSSQTGPVSNDHDMGSGRRVMMGQQHGVVASSMSSEAVRSSMMTVKSHSVETYPAEEKEVPYHALHFPWRLHQMLEAAESHGFSHIVSWLPELQDHDDNQRTHESRKSPLRSGGGAMKTDSSAMEERSRPISRKETRIVGTPFRVHEPGIFEKVIMPRFFRQTKFKSFRRQINLWSFERIRSGPNKGGYQCDYFVRTNPSLCSRMRRSKSNKRPQEDHDEDLLATHSAASSLIREQQENPVVSSMLISQPNNPSTISSASTTELASTEGDSAMTMSGEELDSRTRITTNMDDQQQHHFIGNSLPSSSLSWFENHQVSLLNYAYTVLRVSQDDNASVSNMNSMDPIPTSNNSSTDDIEQELISTFSPSFHMLLDNDDDDSES